MLTAAQQTDVDALNISPEQLAGSAVAGAPEGQKVEVAKQAAVQLTPEQQAELVKSLFPQDSADRRTVYLVGFAVAGVVALGLSLIAWGVSTGTDTAGLASAIVVFASAFASAILGGLLGAYKG